MPIIENKDPAIITIGNRLCHATQTKIHLTTHLIKYQSQSSQQAEGLETIGPHNGLDATFTGIKPNQEDNSND